MVRRRFLDFHKKTYRNPFFKKSKSGFRYLRDVRENKIRLWRRKVVLFFLLITLIGWFWFLFYSPYFKIEKIEIFGLEKIDQNEIKNLIDFQLSKKRFLIFKQDNLFLFDKKLLSKNIKTKYVLDNLIIEKKLFNTLITKISERAAKATLKIGDKVYDLDSNGIVIGERGSIFEDIGLPVVYSESDKEVIIGEKILTENQIGTVNRLSSKISQFTNIKILYYKIPAEKEIKAFTEDGWYILLTDRDLDEQLLKLNLVLKEKIKDQKNLEYIDLRFGDRVYYK